MPAPTPRVHGALLLTQYCWGSAAVVNKLGLSGAGMMPLLFALIREVCAAPILFGILWAARSRASAEGGTAKAEAPRSRGRWVLRLLPGLFIFVDQLCSLTGVMLADPVSLAAWQPSQVVFTTAISACLGMEVLTLRKGLGMLLTVGGALCLVFIDRDTTPALGSSPYVGQLLFFCNCLASSLEVIAWRCLLQGAVAPMVHFAVMAESYLVAACFMVVTCTATSFSRSAVDFFCPECEGNAWHLPPVALWAIGYSVVFQTIVGYCAQAWALRYAEPSLASLYATVQPIMAAVITCVLIACNFNPGSVLTWPGKKMLGAFLIAGGLMVAECGKADEGVSSSGATSDTTSGAGLSNGVSTDSLGSSGDAGRRRNPGSLLDNVTHLT